MPAVDTIKARVQQILANEFGSAEISKFGDFIVEHESVVVYVEVEKGFGDDGTLVTVRCSLVCDVPITPELTRWVAIEGQQFRIGGILLEPNEDETTAWITFRHGMIGDDLDESELLGVLYAVMATSDELDEELQAKFGGTLYLEEDGSLS